MKAEEEGNTRQIERGLWKKIFLASSSGRRGGGEFAKRRGRGKGLVMRLGGSCNRRDPE